MQGLSVSFEYSRSDFKNITMRYNSLRNADSYDRVDVVSPLDGSIIPYYNVKAEFQSAVLNVDTTEPAMKRWFNGFEWGYNARMRGGIRAFGGFNLERSLNDTCVAAVSDPNRLLYCDQRQSGIPWQKQFKSAVVLPLPWQDVTVSAAFQSLNGYLTGTAAQAYGGFTAGTGFDRPNGPARSTRSPAPRVTRPTALGRARRVRWSSRTSAVAPRACRSSPRKRSTRRVSTSSICR
jgi:hypothetical protein